jgi:SAM-dependent methyltransferase
LGLSYYTAREILRCGEAAPLGSVATIGRLQQFLLPSQITALRSAYGLPAGPWSTQAFGGFSEDFFRAAGASSVTSIDASAYEGAEIVHDMNAPTAPELECKFDLVVDGGSIEHIFRPDRAVANVLRMTKIGGHVIIEAPANNLCGHGFYQFSPEFFFAVLSERSGFEIGRMLLIECVYPGVSLVAQRRAYAVRSPREAGERVSVLSRRPLLLLVHATKRAHVDDPFAVAPQQSDYEAQWQDAGGQRSRAAALAIAAARIVKRHSAGTLLAHHFLGVRQRRRYSLRNRDFFTPED